MSKESAMAVAVTQPETSTTNLVSTQTNQTSPTLVPTQDPGSAPTKDSSFERLAKKEAENVRAREHLKKDMAEVHRLREEAQGVINKKKEFDATYQNDPIAAMKMIGFDESHLFNYLAASVPQELTPEQKMVKTAEEIADAKLKAYQEAQTKKAYEAQRAQDSQLIKSYRSDIGKALEAGQDKFEYAADKGPEAAQIAMEMALLKAEESGGEEIYTTEQALEAVNEYYRNEWQRQAKLKGSQDWLKAQTEAPVAKTPTPERTRTITPGFPGQTPQAPIITRTRTLTNNATVTSASLKPAGTESREQKRERLMRKLVTGS